MAPKKAAPKKASKEKEKTAHAVHPEAKPVDASADFEAGFMFNK